MDKSPITGQVLMARQPIFNHKQKAVAYELLYRSDENTNAAVMRVCGSTATSQVLLNAYTSISEEGESRQVPAFINLTEELLLKGFIPNLPRRSLVIEILEDVTITPELIAAVHRLRKEGYRIALDDFEWRDGCEALVELANIVKVDVLKLSMGEIQALVDRLKPSNIVLLAEKVETQEIYEACKAMGFKLFQGYFLSRPRLVRGRKLEGNQISLLQLLEALQRPDVTPQELEKLIVQDPVLTYRLLRIVNSASFKLARKVQSVADAVVLLGQAEIRKWASLIAMTATENRPDELSRQLLLRGYMCEQIAQQKCFKNSSACFMAGIISGLDALLEIEQDVLLEHISLDDDVTRAIRNYDGSIGQLLRYVTLYQSGQFDQLPTDLDIPLYDQAYRTSLELTHKLLQTSQQAGEIAT
ncbi:MAG: HDOD domain-containing protein [Marinobacterium sp.]|nr:HDOD domain-containing protein [Marinobacterium sp.]